MEPGDRQHGMADYVYKTYGTAHVYFELDGIHFEARRDKVAGLIFYTDALISTQQYDRAKTIAERAFEIMDLAVKRSLVRMPPKLWDRRWLSE